MDLFQQPARSYSFRSQLVKRWKLPPRFKLERYKKTENSWPMARLKVCSRDHGLHDHLTVDVASLSDYAIPQSAEYSRS
jgi:hypothetical protein